ncbi:MAG: response regulator transcription factor [Planctomycetales bacterium]
MKSPPASEAETDQDDVKRVLIVDDHPLIHRALGAMIDDEPDLACCGAARDQPEALRKFRELQPRLVIVDISLGDGQGFDVIKRIRALDDQVAILVVSVFDEHLLAERGLRSGAQGYVSKSAPEDEVLTAIRRVLDGKIYLSPQVVDRILRRLSGTTGRALLGFVEDLSDRELSIFELIGKGLASKEIGGKLHISPKTVDAHCEKLKEKLGAKNRSELTHHAIRWLLENL